MRLAPGLLGALLGPAALPAQETVDLGPYVVTPTGVHEGARRAVVTGSGTLWSNDSGRLEPRVIGELPAGLPRLETTHPLLGAVYRMALEEALLDVRPDGALMAGKEWTGVWTRDVSYSVHLALAQVLPEASRRSLLAKTFDGRIRQDTGTGGAWPVSTDRTVWSLAARELYRATGDEAFRRQALELIRGMAEEDWRVARDPDTGLMRGESSFMDWREQTYPTWMEPIDIYQARCLGTNVLHHETYRVLASLSGASEDPSTLRAWEARARALSEALDTWLWDEAAGLYRGFLYPEPDDSASHQTEALGNALTVLLGVAGPERSRRIVACYPVSAFGVPTIHPQKARPAQPYHNRSVWPFVQAYWSLASARAGDAAGFERGLAALLRAAALFGSHKENLVLQTGRPEGTVVNSDRQLWSVAGFLALVHRGLFGVWLEDEGVALRPMVPAWLAGGLRLSGLRVRDATLDLEVRGTGSRLVSVRVNGRRVRQGPGVLFPYHRLRGATRVVMEVEEAPAGMGPLVLGPGDDGVAPDCPGGLALTESPEGGSLLSWQPGPRSEEGAAVFEVLRDGHVVAETRETHWADPRPLDASAHVYVVRARDAAGNRSPHSRPVLRAPAGWTPLRWEAEAGTRVGLEGPVRATGASGGAFVDLRGRPGSALVLRVRLPREVRGALRVRYANGAGPVNTGQVCALRSLRVDGVRRAAVVMPQRGQDAWDDWGWSNPVPLRLSRGEHEIRLVLGPEDRNMDPAVNAARVDLVELAPWP